MIEELDKVCKVKTDIDLKNYNTLKLQSSALGMINPKNIRELAKALEILKKHKTKHFIIGNGSNIILPRFFNGIVIKLDKLNKYEIHEGSVYAESGVMINKLAMDLVDKGYSGLDFATGIPGTVGGCIYGNAGCYKSSISDVLIDATIYNGKDIITFTNKDFMFDYRYSVLKNHKDYIILSANFKIEKSDVEELKSLVVERTKKRVETQDLKNPSNGSMFKNPEGFAAGKLIDDLGLKGYSINDASISTKHANFIINKGNATQEDILELVDFIKDKVKKEYNIDLKMEQEIIK